MGDDILGGGQGGDRIGDVVGANQIRCGAGSDLVRTNAESMVADDCEDVRCP